MISPNDRKPQSTSQITLHNNGRLIIFIISSCSDDKNHFTTPVNYKRLFFTVIYYN